MAPYGAPSGSKRLPRFVVEKPSGGLSRQCRRTRSSGPGFNVSVSSLTERVGGGAAGQLEAEIGRGDWMLEHPETNAVFKPDAERPWPTPLESEVSI